MKKTLSKILFFALLFCAFADDGGSYYPEDWTYGNIYVKEPNEKIALEKELMIVEQSSRWHYDKKSNTNTKVFGNEVEAIFGFKNTTAQKVVVPCAFPVVVTTQVTTKKNGKISNRIHVGNSFNAKQELISLAVGRKLTQQETENTADLGSLNATKEDFLSLDKKLKTLSIDEYLALFKEIGGSETLAPCVIVQDGKDVRVQTVGIETSIERHDSFTENIRRKDNERYGDDEVYNLKVVLHFFHELTFKPNASSVLSVKYAISTKKGGRDYEHRFCYDISTGGTWKGDIKSFVLLTDSSVNEKNSITKFEITDLGEMFGISRVYLYATENYKPQKNEYFEFCYRISGDYYDGEVYLQNRNGMQDFVSGVRASSELSGTYKMAGTKKDEYDRDNTSDKNSDDNLVTSTYEAKTSFDGNLLNGWVEGVKGDGIGEWIEFTLSKNVIGPLATNGLRRFGGSLKGVLNPDTYEYCSYDYDDENFKVYKKAGGIIGAWKSNNRVKSMSLSRDGKSVAQLDFYDRCLELYTIPSDWIGQNAIKNPQFLQKGTYRMTIDSVYKGKKWDDTVLGEVWFIPIEDNAAKIILNDDFFKKPVTQEISQMLR